jgi:hypothetical protein
MTAAWLDPLAIIDGQDAHREHDPADDDRHPDDILPALRVTRRCFPQIYARAIQKIRAGEANEPVTDFIALAIQKKTQIPVDQYVEPYIYCYGIPLPYYGIDIEDPQELIDRPGLAQLARLLGASLPDSLSAYRRCWQTDFWSSSQSVVWATADALRWSLWQERHRPLHDDLQLAIAYAFADTGNSCADFTWDDGASMPPLDWTPANVEFAEAMIREAHELLDRAHSGLSHIATDPAVRTTLGRQISRIHHHINQLQTEGKHDYEHINRNNPNPFNLQWDDLSLGSA